MNKKKLAIQIILSSFVAGIIAWILPNWTAMPFGVYFSLIVPGLLLYLIIRTEIVLRWESVLFVVGLGVSNIIFTSISINFLLRSIGYTRPLTALPLFVSFSIVNLLLVIFGYRRWSISTIIIPKFSLSKNDLIALLSPVVLLLCFIGGAIRLNNGSSGSLSILSYIFATIIIVWLFVEHRKIKTSCIIWALWITALGILLSSWVRSDYVTGIDVVKEFQIFQLIKHSGYWSMNLYKNVYTACLSVSILPVSLSIFTKLPDILIFKLLIPAIYSLIVPVVFLISRSQVKTRNAILATFFFFSQTAFTIWWWIPIRQEIAFLFFALIILLFINSKKSLSDKVLFLIFGISMVVSHYSTSYIAIGIFTIFYIIRKLPTNFKTKNEVNNNVMGASLIIVLLIFTFFWYSQATLGFNNVTQFVTKSFQNVGSLFSSDVQEQGQKPLSQFNIFSNAGQAPITAQEYVTQKEDQAKRQYSASKLYQFDFSYQDPTYQPGNSINSARLSLSRNVLKVIGNFLISFGVIVSMVIAWRRKHFSSLIILQISSLIVLVTALLLPFFSINYGEDRLYLQLLIIVCCSMTVYTTLKFLNKRKKKILEYGLLVFVVLYFLLLNEVPQQFTMSSQQSVALGNNNEQYYIYDIDKSDVLAASWLHVNNLDGTPIVGDFYSQFRLMTGGGLKFGNYRVGVIPGALPTKSYVYQDNTNTETGTAFDNDQGLILYKFPINFLKSNKNTVYTNSSDEVYF